MSRCKFLNVYWTENDSGSAGLGLFNLFHMLPPPQIISSSTDEKCKKWLLMTKPQGIITSLCICHSTDYFSAFQQIVLVFTSNMWLSHSGNVIFSIASPATIICPTGMKAEFTPNLPQRLADCFPFVFRQNLPRSLT